MTTEVELLFTCLLGIIFLFYDGLERLSPLKICMKQTKKQKWHLLLLFSRSVMSDSLQPHGLHTACQAFLSFTISSSLLKLMSIESLMPSTISSSVVPFSFYLQSFPGSVSFPMSWLFASGGQSIGVSAPASVLPMNIQDWFPLRLSSLILQSKELSRVFSNTTFLGSRILKYWPVTGL